VAQGGQEDVAAAALRVWGAYHTTRFLPARTDLAEMDHTDSMCFPFVFERNLRSEKLVFAFIPAPRTDDNHSSPSLHRQNVGPAYARVGPQPVDNQTSELPNDCTALDD
jgi:hypothetical protein